MNIAIAVIILLLEKAIAMSDKITENPLKNLIAKGTDDTRSSFDRYIARCPRPEFDMNE